jgi:Icc-related predicted phosphoesterase
MIVDIISDPHGFYPALEGGDLLIIAGDLTARDDFQEWKTFFKWIATLTYKKKIVICGNHDRFMEYNPGFMFDEKDSFEYLCDSGTEFQGLKIYGSPWTKSFAGENPKCLAFTCETEEELADHWKCIPEDTDILVTHSPPFTIRDGRNPNQNLGSRSLMKRISKINLKLHVFGHIHEGYGIMDLQWLKLKNGFKGGLYVNASHVNEYYEPVNPPIRVVL